jgi:hypothetical protein
VHKTEYLQNQQQGVVLGDGPGFASGALVAVGHPLDKRANIRSMASSEGV